MEMWLLAVMLLFAAVASRLPSSAVAANYTAGDEKGWNPDVDYTAAWVKKHKPFYKGDWLSKHHHCIFLFFNLLLLSRGSIGPLADPTIHCIDFAVFEYQNGKNK